MLKKRKHRLIKLHNREKAIYCPMCGDFCGRGMGSGRIYMLHHTVGCELAKLY